MPPIEMRDKVTVKQKIERIAFFLKNSQTMILRDLNQPKSSFCPHIHSPYTSPDTYTVLPLWFITENNGITFEPAETVSCSCLQTKIAYQMKL